MKLISALHMYCKTERKRVKALTENILVRPGSEVPLGRCEGNSPTRFVCYFLHFREENQHLTYLQLAFERAEVNRCGTS